MALWTRRDAFFVNDQDNVFGTAGHPKIGEDSLLYRLKKGFKRRQHEKSDVESSTWILELGEIVEEPQRTSKVLQDCKGLLLDLWIQA